MEIINNLVGQLGISEDQAKGGAGAIFSLLKKQVSGEDFNKIASVVPGMNGLLTAAPEAGGLSGALGGLTSKLGGGAEKAGGLASLASGFKKLGLDAGMVAKFVPVVMSFVQAKGGDSLKNILEKVLS